MFPDEQVIVGFIKLASSIVGPDAEIVIPPYDDVIRRVPGDTAEAASRARIRRRLRGRAGRHPRDEKRRPRRGGARPRLWLHGDQRRGLLPMQFHNAQVDLGKNFDTFCPMGPCIVTRDELPTGQPSAVARQRRTTPGHAGRRAAQGRLHAAIEWLSSVITLEPGDILSTGTPAGCGTFMDPPRFLQPGDTVTVSASGIGELTNPVVQGGANARVTPPSASRDTMSGKGHVALVTGAGTTELTACLLAERGCTWRSPDAGGSCWRRRHGRSRRPAVARSYCPATSATPRCRSSSSTKPSGAGPARRARQQRGRSPSGRSTASRSSTSTGALRSTHVLPCCSRRRPRRTHRLSRWRHRERLVVGRQHRQAGQRPLRDDEAALEYLTRASAYELADRRIRVNCIAPGRRHRSTRWADDLEAAQTSRRVPLGRMALPEEIAVWAWTLVDPASAWTTGNVIHVDGGFQVLGLPPDAGG